LRDIATGGDEVPMKNNTSARSEKKRESTRKKRRTRVASPNEKRLPRVYARGNPVGRIALSDSAIPAQSA